MGIEIDKSLVEAVNSARLMFAAHVSSTKEIFPDHVAVIFKDIHGSVMACVNFTMPEPEQDESCNFRVTQLSGELVAQGKGLVEWAKFLYSNNWLASWVAI